MDALQYWHRFKSKIFFFIKYFWTSVALSLSLPRFLQLINLCIVVRYILQLILVHLSHTLMCFTKCRTLPCSAGEWLLRMPLSTVTCYRWTCLPVEYFKGVFGALHNFYSLLLPLSQLDTCCCPQIQHGHTFFLKSVKLMRSSICCYDDGPTCRCSSQ